MEHNRGREEGDEPCELDVKRRTVTMWCIGIQIGEAETGFGNTLVVIDYILTARRNEHQLARCRNSDLLVSF